MLILLNLNSKNNYSPFTIILLSRFSAKPHFAIFYQIPNTKEEVQMLTKLNFYLP